MKNETDNPCTVKMQIEGLGEIGIEWVHSDKVIVTGLVTWQEENYSFCTGLLRGQGDWDWLAPYSGGTPACESKDRRLAMPNELAQRIVLAVKDSENENLLLPLLADVRDSTEQLNEIREMLTKVIRSFARATAKDMKARKRLDNGRELLTLSQPEGIEP